MYQVIWSELAADSFQEILGFVYSQWNLETAFALEERINKLLETLEQNPLLFQKEKNNPNIRKCVVNKQISMIYEIGENNIILIVFIDNRSDHQYY